MFLRVLRSFDALQNLLNVDRYRYEKEWELNAEEALAKLYDETTATHVLPGTSNRLVSTSHLDGDIVDFASLQCLRTNSALLDLRTTTDFNIWHLSGATNLPLHSLSTSTASPFTCANVMEAQWLELKEKLDPKHTPSAESLLAYLKGRFVVLICYNGDTSYVATSILRAQGIEAFSIKNGLCALPCHG